MLNRHTRFQRFQVSFPVADKTEMSFVRVCLLISFLLSALGATRAIARVEISAIYDFKHGAHEYSVLVISPASVLRRGLYSSVTDELQAQMLITRVKRWIVEQYILRYPNEDPEELKKMVEADDFADGRSSILVVTAKRDVNTIYATQRFVWSNSDDPKLPLEKYLEINLKPEPFSYGKYPLSVELWRDQVKLGFVDDYVYETRSGISGRVKRRSIPKMRLSGATVEIKNFIVSKTAPEDLVPLLFYMSEKTEISYSFLNQPLRKLTELPELRHLDPSLLSSDWGPRFEYAHPSRYVLYAKPPMDVYYRSLGFQLYPEQPENRRDLLFQMDRETYARSIGDRFAKRPGYRVLTEGQMEWVPLGHLYQGEITGIPSVQQIRCSLNLQPFYWGSSPYQRK